MASRYNLKYEYSTDNRKTWIEITDFVDSAQTEITYNLCSTEFKSAKDKASFYLPATDSPEKKAFIQALYDVDTIYARISQKSDDTLLFLGIVDKSSLSIRSIPLAPSLTISLDDISSANLDNAVDVHVALWDSEDSRLTITNIVKYLITLAGYEYTSSTIRANEDVILPCFVVDKDNAKTYREYIDTLLFEVGGYVLDFNTEGKADIVRLDWSDAGASKARIVDNVRISNGVSTKTSVLKNDGVKLTWSTIAESATNQIVYQDSISRSTDDAGYLVGDDVVKGGYWPEDGDITATYQEFSADFLDKPYLIQDSRKKNEDLTILAVKDVYAYIQATDKNHKKFTDWTYPILPSLGMEKNPALWPTKAWYLLRNDSNDTVNLQFFNLYGTVVYRSKINETMTPENTKDPKEYTSTYIYESAHAQRFSQFYWHFLNTSRFISDWKEINDGTLGEVVRLTHKGMAFGQDALVVSKKVKWLNYDTQDVSLTAVGISTYNAYASKEISSIQGRTSKDGQDGKDGASITVQYAYSTSETEPPEEAIMQWAGANIYWSDGQAYWSEWYDKAPVPKEGYYIWMRSKVGDGEWSYTRLTGSTGVQGVGILEIVEKYARNNDSTTAPDESAFSTDIPKLASNIRFLWNYEIVKLTDGTEKTTAKRIIGVYGDTGATGYSQALITLYQRSATVPSKPSNDTVYYFATGVLEGDIGLWSRAVTTGDDPLYAISASALGQGESYTIESTAWTTPAIMSESGTAGENGYTVMSITIYQRADSAPSVPTNATYNIESKTLSEIGSWSKTYPENSDKPLWATLATISTRESSVSIPSSSWSTPQVLTQNGATGNGIASITNYYLASASDSGITREGSTGWNPDPTTQTTSPVVKYLWNYEDILYTNGSHDYSEARIIGTYGDSGTPAKLCTLTCDHTTVARNERRSDYQTVAFIVDVQGYKNAPSLFVNDAEVTLSQSTTVSTQYSASMNVYYNSAESLVAIVYIDSVQLDKVSISVVDETENGIYLGIQTAFPTTYGGLALLAGDSCVYNNRVYIYNPAVQEGQEPWQIASESSLTDLQKSHALSSAMNDILSSITADTITSSDYAYFKTLITDTISADYISSQEITVTKSIQSATITSEKGFKLSSDGTITANKATLNNVQILDGEFSADSLKTQNADENGSFYAITGTPSESCSASTEVKSVADDGTVTTVGTLTKTQDNYYKTKDFAQWCLDNIPVSNAGFTQLEGTIDGYNAYAMRFSSTPSASYTKLISGSFTSPETKTQEATVDCGLYQRRVDLRFYRSGNSALGGQSIYATIYDNDKKVAYFVCEHDSDGNPIYTLNGKNISWSTSDYSSDEYMYTLPLSFSAGTHTLKFVLNWSGIIAFTKYYSFYISTTDVVTPYWSRLALQNSNSILLMLYPSDSSIVFNGGTASNPLKVISINSDITDNTTMTSLGSLTPNDTTYSTMAVNLLYNGVACVCGGNQTSWTVTRYFKFLGLYNCGAGSWATPTIANTISVKVKNAFIDGTQQSQELTLQYNGTNLTLTSDDKTIAYQLGTGDYYTSLPSICMTAIASSKGAYVSSLYPMQAGESDIGSASQPFDQVYANSYRNMFPVGAIYMSVNPTSPASLFGGRWEEIHDRFLVGAGNLYAVNEQDGEASHVLTVEELPSHTHTYNNFRYGGGQTVATPGTGSYWMGGGSSTSGSTGSGTAHNNLPPYLAVYMWKRLPDSTT